MPFDPELADRLRVALHGEDALAEKRMFGGLAFLVNGHLAVAASSWGGLLVRVNPAATGVLLAETGAAPMVMRGREMDGWLRVSAEAVTADVELEKWVARSLDYVRGLPPK